MSFDRLLRASQDYLMRVLLKDSNGSAITGVAYNTAGLLVQYRTDNQATWTTVTLVAGTLGTYVSSSWIEDQNGSYQLCLPVAAYAVANATQIFVEVSGVANQIPAVMEFQRDLGTSNPQGVQPVQDAGGYLQTMPAAYTGSTSITPSTTTLNFSSLYQLTTTPYMLLYSGGNVEIVQVTAVSFGSGDTTLTVVRGLFGTSAITASTWTLQCLGSPAALGAGAVGGLALAGGQMDLVAAPNATALTAIATADAAKILKSPTQPLATDASGNVTANNTGPGISK